MTATRIHRELDPISLDTVSVYLSPQDSFLVHNAMVLSPCMVFRTSFVATFTLYFFRYRDAALPEDFSSQSLLSPADGHVVALEPSLREDLDALRLSIYLHGTDTHLIRIPCSGKVVNVTYHPGKHLVAFNPKSSLLNERLEVGIEHVSGKTVTMTLVVVF